MSQAANLAPNLWNTLARRNNVRDNGLQRALVTYDNLEVDDHDARLRAIASVIQLAGSLKRAREVIAVPAVVRALTDLTSAAQAAQREIAGAQAAAERAEATAARTQAQATRREQAGAGADESEEEEAETGDYRENLKIMYRRLKSSRELEYHFIICDAKPQSAFIISKQSITTRHKAELTRVTGGSQRFLKPGTCYVDNGKLVFNMERPPVGLAAKLKNSFKYFTGLNIGFLVGSQSDEDEEAGEAQLGALPESASDASSEAGDDVEAGETISARGGPAALEVESAGVTRASGRAAPESTASAAVAQSEVEAAGGPPRAGAPRAVPRATVARAPQVWHGTRGIVDRRIQALKQAVRAEYANEEPDLVREIDQKVGRLDTVLDHLDHRLADALSNVSQASTQTAITAQLRNARTILSDYINYVRSEPLIAAIDQNPFAVNTGLRRLLTDSLTHMAQAIGTGAAR